MREYRWIFSTAGEAVTKSFADRQFGVHSTPLVAGVFGVGSRQQDACDWDASKKTRALTSSKLELLKPCANAAPTLPHVKRQCEQNLHNTRCALREERAS